MTAYMLPNLGSIRNTYLMAQMAVGEFCEIIQDYCFAVGIASGCPFRNGLGWDIGG